MMLLTHIKHPPPPKVGGPSLNSCAQLFIHSICSYLPLQMLGEVMLKTSLS